MRISPQKLKFGTTLILLVGTTMVSENSDASASLTSEPLPVGVITAVRLHDSSSGAERGVTFGIPFAEGELENQANLIVTTSDGEDLQSQWNPLASWRTDGSTLHGAMTILTPDTGDNDGIYYIKRGDPAVGDAISAKDIASAGFDADVVVTLAGERYELSAGDLLNGTIEARLSHTHFDGPIASEFMIGGPLRLNGTGAAHNTLQAYFYIRAYKRPVEQVYVTVVLENTGAFNPLSDITANSVDIRVGGQSLPAFPKSQFTIYADIRYTKRSWWNTSDDIWVQHDLGYVSSTKLMPDYRPVTMRSTELGAFPQASEWNQRRILSEPNLESGGAKPEIAPYDHWTSAYMVSGDKRAWNAMRTAVDEYSMMVSNHGRGVVHARDEETGFPLDLTVKGVVGRVWYGSGGMDVLNASRDGRPVAQADIAHWPSIGYLVYLLTAESNELENVQHSAIQPWLNEAPGGHKGTIPGRTVRFLQTRGMAWALREIINGAVITPDLHPLRNALQVSASYALEEYGNAAFAADPSNRLGIWLAGGNSPLPYDNNTGFAPWMNDFLTWSIGSAYERGWQSELDASGFWDWSAQGIIGRFGRASTTEYCWEKAAAYKLKIRDTSSTPVFNSWNEIYLANFDGAAGCAAPGTASIGTDRNAVDYGAQIAGGLSIAVSTGIVGSLDAWKIYERRQKSWADWTFDVSPEWALEPRNVQTAQPKPPENLIAY